MRYTRIACVAIIKCSNNIGQGFSTCYDNLIVNWLSLFHSPVFCSTVGWDCAAAIIFIYYVVWVYTRSLRMYGTFEINFVNTRHIISHRCLNSTQPPHIRWVYGDLCHACIEYIPVSKATAIARVFCIWIMLAYQNATSCMYLCLSVYVLERIFQWNRFRICLNRNLYLSKNMWICASRKCTFWNVSHCSMPKLDEMDDGTITIIV